MPKPPGKCIFCGKGGLTKQHVWADWLKSVVPRNFAGHRQTRTGGDFSLGIEPLLDQPMVTSRQGDPGTKKVRVVCGPCNSGWMSRLENRAKPILTPMIRGECFELRSSAQAMVSAWMAMTVMVVEHDDPRTVTIGVTDRERLMKTGSPSEHWRVRIGRYNGARLRSSYRHHAFAFAYVGNDGSLTVHPIIFGSDTGYNLQVTTMVTGELVFQSFSCADPARVINHTAYADTVGLRCIFPETAETISRSDLPILGDAEVDRVSNTLKELFISARADGRAIKM